MKKKYLSFFCQYFKIQKPFIPTSISTLHYLERDLNNCLSLADIDTIKEVLRYCENELTECERLDLLKNIDYRKRLIKYCINYLPEKRYSITQINDLFINTGSYAVCDAILLHIKINKEFYLQQFGDLSPLQDTCIFDKMAERQKTFIWKKFKLQIKQA